MSQNIRFAALTQDDLDSTKTFFKKEQRFDGLARLAAQVLFERGSSDVNPSSFRLISNTDAVGVVSYSGKYLRLLLVDSDFRQKGYGTRLLDQFEEASLKQGVERVQTMAEPGNYISPGIDLRHKETIEWFKRRGYSEKTHNQNIFIDVVGNPNVSEEHLKNRQKKSNSYVFERLTKEKLPLWKKEIEMHFSKGWAFEVGLAVMNNSPSGAHVAYDNHGEPAAFAAHDGNNAGLGWFGPIGTFVQHRGKGLAAALLISCLLDVKAAGHKQCEIAWIGPRGFYEKVAGVCGERNFIVLEKQLSKGA